MKESRRGERGSDYEILEGKKREKCFGGEHNPNDEEKGEQERGTGCNHSTGGRKGNTKRTSLLGPTVSSSQKKLGFKTGAYGVYSSNRCQERKRIGHQDVNVLWERWCKAGKEKRQARQTWPG